MQKKFQILDADYFMNGSAPVIRLFGKTVDGKTVCAFVNGVKPYFYVLPKYTDDDSTEKLKEYLKKEFPHFLLDMVVVERFLPIGYQSEKTKLIKITLTSPSKVPLVRDSLREQSFVKDVYEADVLFKYRYMVDNGLAGMMFVDVEGKPTNTKIVDVDYRIDVDSIKPVEASSEPDLKYMAFDIEIASSRAGLPDATRDEIAMISLAFSPKYKKYKSVVMMIKHLDGNGDSSIMTYSSEKEMLEGLLKIIREFDPDVVTGYNVNGFDIPYLLERFRQNGMQANIGRCRNKSATNRKFGMWSRSDIPGRVVVDAYELIKDAASKGMMKLKRYGLGDVSKELLGEDKVDVEHSEITEYWNGSVDQLRKLIRYNRKDSVLALKLILEKNLLDKFIELSKVSGVLLQDALSGGEASRVENLLLKEFNSRGYVVPCRPTKSETARRVTERKTRALKGAIVLEPETGLHKECVVYLDFKSLYPSIYISYNICPTTILPKDGDVEVDTIDTPYGKKFVSPDVKTGIIPDIVDQLIRERDVVKRKMKVTHEKEEKRQLNAKQFALKIQANAFYGYTGYIRAKLYVLDIANAITSCGRDLIRRTQETVNNNTKYNVIYGDTDSVMVKTDTTDIDRAYEIGGELEEHINEALDNIVKMKIECVFKTLIILTKKRYAGWSFEKTRDGVVEEKITMKGIETVRRDWCDLVSETMFRVLEIILKEQNPKKAFDYVRGVHTKLQNNDVPIEKLVISKSVTKPIDSYKGIQPHIELVKKMKRRSPNDAPGVGDRVGYVITQGLQLLSNRAENPDYIKEHKLKIDSNYYIENQLIPPLERVFESMGIQKSELLGKGRQTNLMNMLGNGNNRKDSGKSSLQEPLDDIDGVICSKCRKTYTRPPLVGKCISCDGDVLFYKGMDKSKYYNVSN